MNKKGFTLIEMLLGISLVAAMTGVTFAQFRNYNQQQEIRAASERLKQVIKEAKTNALIGKKDCYTCGGPDGTCDGDGDLDLVGWKVELTSGGYRIVGLCGPLETEFFPREETFDNVSIVTTPGSEVLYKPLDGGTDLGVTSLYITVEGSDDDESFAVSPAGEIVPPPPTSTPTIAPPPTNTPTPMPLCNTSIHKCVTNTSVCSPPGTYPESCNAGYKCVRRIATCTDSAI